MTAVLVPDIIEQTPHMGQVSIYRSTDPVEQLAEAQARAAVLVQVITDQHLATDMGSGRKPHVNVEGWTFLASQFGLIPDVEWTKPLDDGWEARACLRRISDGFAVSHAEAECRKSEDRWRNADSYAVRSMASTRAVSKVCRIALSSVMVLAGYSGTPAEEMTFAETTQPGSVEDPHCPACLVVHGALVAVREKPTKPYWQCTATPGECGAPREYKGRSYSWAGWEPSFTASAADWRARNPGVAGPLVSEVGGRANRWTHVLDEVMRLLGLPDHAAAKPVAKAGLVSVVVGGSIDIAEAYPEAPMTPLDGWSDTDFGHVARCLTAEEADLVIGEACQMAGASAHRILGGPGADD